MKISISVIRVFFIALCILLITSYTTVALDGGLNATNVVLGLMAGTIFSLLLIGLDVLFKKWSFYSFNIALLGIICGYFMGEAVMLVFNAIFHLSPFGIAPAVITLIKTFAFLSCTYFGVTLATKTFGELLLMLPFGSKNASPKKKDIIVDWTVLQDARIIELAASGLLDDSLIVPQFVFKELYVMLDNSDETIKSRGRRCLEAFKKLEGISTLGLRYSDVDFPEILDYNLKLLQLAGSIDANIITADAARLQQYAMGRVRIIHMHLLSNAIKPISGEQLMIKIQRYGKEPRQGVGYLDDGTMVVVNGAAEYIGETIKALVLSVKHTASGRMIFCNTAEESADAVESLLNHVSIDLDQTQKNYYTV